MAMYEPQVAHVANVVHDMQQQLAAKIQQIQKIIQAMKMQYSGARLPTYQVFRFIMECSMEDMFSLSMIP